jgi:acyl-CoA thioester hydrolase
MTAFGAPGDPYHGDMETDEASATNVYVTRVRTHQTDLNAAMYHGAFLDVFDDARIETFRRVGYDYARMLAGGWSPVIRRIQCEYVQPARMDDRLTIQVHIVRLTVATMVVRYRCFRATEKLAEAFATFAFLDGRGRVIRFPTDLREVIEAHPEITDLNSETPSSNRRSRASGPPV